MHISFLEYLADPKTKEPLVLTAEKKDGDVIIEGALKSPSNTYPIVRGIPRFAGYKDDKNYTKSFGYQWNKWSKIQFDSENIGRPMENWTKKMWERITAVKSDDLQKSLIIDYGCGPGRFLDTVRNKNGKAIGIDLSDAVEAAGEIFKGDKNVMICQGDVLNTPFKSEIADGVFSIGVLHHTTGPQKGFDEMTRTLKNGGWLAVSVYGKGYYNQTSVRIYRKIFKTLWPIFKHYPPLFYSFATVYGLRPFFHIPHTRKIKTILGPMIKSIFPFADLPDRRWSLLDTFDSLTPSHQSFHTAYEVFQWFKSAKLADIEPSDWGGTSMHGIKPNSQQ